VYGRDHDLYQNLNAPRMLQYVKGDFTVTTKVTINPQQNYQAAGLLYWQDENNYVRLERTLVKGIDLLYKIQGEYNAVEISFSASTTFLKFELSNQTLQGFYSEDGYNWSIVEAVQVPPCNNGQVGIDVVNEWQDNSITADFDFFMFSQCP
jgi:regulation of enolase protein 1 (concanavalin A-like superfamily)